MHHASNSGSGRRGEQLQRLHEMVPWILLDSCPLLATPRHLKPVVHQFFPSVEKSPFAAHQVKIRLVGPFYPGVLHRSHNRDLRMWDTFGDRLGLDRDHEGGHRIGVGRTRCRQLHRRGRHVHFQLWARHEPEVEHGCQMAIARFLGRRCLALRASGTMAPLRYAAKFDPFLSLYCARVEGMGAQSKERKGSNFAIWQP